MDNKRNNINQEVRLEGIEMEEKTNNNIDYNKVNMDISNNANHNRLSYEIKSEESIDKDLRMSDEKFEVPPHLKKTFICSLILFVIGATLIGIGFIQDVAAADPGKGITFWTLGGIVMIPGGYYSYQFFKAKRTKNFSDREDILSEIPEL